MACCPVGSLPYLAATSEAKGQVVDARGVMLYETPVVGNPTEALLLCPDVWGWNGGRVRAVADGLAEQGYHVVVAKLLATPGQPGTDGDALAPDDKFSMAWIKNFPWSLQKAKIDAALAYLTRKGAQKIGVMGFCYGGHPACWASRENNYPVKCGVVFHPSMQLEQFAFGGDLKALLSGVQCPFLLAPAGDDLETWGEDSANSAALKDSSRGAECVWKPYPEMSHGWSCRGDLSVPAVARDVDLVMKDAISFFNKYLKA